MTILGCNEGKNIEQEIVHRDVEATFETQKTDMIGDSLDDPAFWLNSKNKSLSMILGANKQGGVSFYSLEGEELLYQSIGSVNNLDVVKLNIRNLVQDYVFLTNRTTNTLQAYKLNGYFDYMDMDSEYQPSEFSEVYGLCASNINGEIFIVITSKSGNVELVKFNDNLENPITKVWRLKLDFQSEGCVIDPDNNVVYVGEEQKGIWKTEINSPNFNLHYEVDGDLLSADVEGLTIIEYKEKKYLAASSQGDDSFFIISDDKDLIIKLKINYAKHYKVTHTDGIHSVNYKIKKWDNLGALVVQDDNEGRHQNFKVINHSDIFSGIR